MSAQSSAVNTQPSSELLKVSSPNPNGFRDLSPEAVVRHRQELRLIDVRQPEEFNAELGHIQGAELVPLATVAQVAAAWPKNQVLVMVCRSGGRSGNAATQLARMGFSNVFNMMGGMLGWNANQLPVER